MSNHALYSTVAANFAAPLGGAVPAYYGARYAIQKVVDPLFAERAATVAKVAKAVLTVLVGTLVGFAIGLGVGTLGAMGVYGALRKFGGQEISNIPDQDYNDYQQFLSPLFVHASTIGGTIAGVTAAVQHLNA